MKTKILLFAIILILLHTNSFAQLMSFGFIKNCMTFKRETVTNELTKKHFFIVDRKIQTANNALLVGATYYSNQKEGAKVGEISVLSLIGDTKKITEISFIKGLKNDYETNYKEIVNQMLTFFSNENTFKSAKFKVDVSGFSKNEIYYYAFINNQTPTIVISDFKLETSYFSNQ